MRRDMKQKKDCGKITIAIIILEFLVSSIGILSGFIWKANNNSVLWENLIYPKVKIATIDVSGKTKLEAINIIKNLYLSAFMSKKISVVGNDKTYVIEYSKLINNVNIEKIINEAINYGKDINLLEKNKIIRTGANKKFSFTYSYDEDYLKSIISEIEKNFRKEPVNASIEKSSDGKLQFISSINGYKVIR
jgi:vancomycin resistance protein YoaR